MTTCTIYKVILATVQLGLETPTIAREEIQECNSLENVSVVRSSRLLCSPLLD